MAGITVPTTPIAILGPTLISVHKTLTQRIPKAINDNFTYFL